MVLDIIYLIFLYEFATWIILGSFIFVGFAAKSCANSTEIVIAPLSVSTTSYLKLSFSKCSI